MRVVGLILFLVENFIEVLSIGADPKKDYFFWSRQNKE
jgi:hypothetical protein